MHNGTPPPSQADILAAQLLLAKAKKKPNSKARSANRRGKASSKPTISAPEPSSDQENEAAKVTEKDEVISWAKNPDYTDKLLTILEDSTRYRKAFGFAGGDLPGVTSGGLTNIQMCRDIASMLFPSSSADVTKLALSIKNRITMLKNTYRSYRDKLGQTGHGLLIEDREAEIISGTLIACVYDKIQAKFKWYKRLHTLLNESPVFDTSAVVHGASPLDLSILSPTQQPVRGTSPDWDYSALDNSFEASQNESQPVVEKATEADAPHPAPDVVPSRSSSLLATTSTPARQPVQEAVPTGGTSSMDSTNRSILKRKNPFDHVKELSEKHHNAKLERAKLRREQEERALATQLKIEQMKLTAQRELIAQNRAAEERHQQHELTVLDRQIELARLQAGPLRQINIPNAPSTSVIPL